MNSLFRRLTWFLSFVLIIVFKTIVTKEREYQLLRVHASFHNRLRSDDACYRCKQRKIQTIFKPVDTGQICLALLITLT